MQPLCSIPALLLALGTAGCDYAGLLRPSVLSELNPPVARLVNDLPDLDAPNKALVAQLFAVGGLSHAREDADGIMRADITVPPYRMMWQPAIIDLPHGGPLELRFANHDQAFHIAYLPSNGGRQVLELPAQQAGIARLRSGAAPSTADRSGRARLHVSPSRPRCDAGTHCPGRHG